MCIERKRVFYSSFSSILYLARIAYLQNWNKNRTMIYLAAKRGVVLGKMNADVLWGDVQL